MKIHKKVQSKSKLSQKFNLKELLGYNPSAEQKELFFNLAVDKMVNRTASGDDINGTKFGSYAPYSKEYAKKKGVAESSVDLILTGDMLNAIKKGSPSINMVEIKIEGKEAPKAHGHDTGEGIAPKREFFGFNSEDDLADVIEQVDLIRDQEDTFTSTAAGAAMDLVALRAAIAGDITVEFSGFQDTEEGTLNRMLLTQLRNTDGQG